MSTILLLYNRGDLVAEQIIPRMRTKTNGKVCFLAAALDELYLSREFVHHIRENGTPVTFFRLRDGRVIDMNTAGLIFNRIRYFPSGYFLNHKDSAYASAEWLAIFGSVLQSLKEKTVNFNFRLWVTDFDVNRLHLLKLCKDEGIKIEPLSTLDDRQTINKNFNVAGLKRLLFFNGCFFGNVSPVLTHKLSNVMKKLNFDFAEIFFSGDRLVTCNPYPAVLTDYEIDFVIRSLLSKFTLLK